MVKKSNVSKMLSNLGKRHHATAYARGKHWYTSPYARIAKPGIRLNPSLMALGNPLGAITNKLGLSGLDMVLYGVGAKVVTDLAPKLVNKIVSIDTTDRWNRAATQVASAFAMKYFLPYVVDRNISEFCFKVGLIIPAAEILSYYVIDEALSYLGLGNLGTQYTIPNRNIAVGPMGSGYSLNKNMGAYPPNRLSTRLSAYPSTVRLTGLSSEQDGMAMYPFTSRSDMMY